MYKISVPIMSSKVTRNNREEYVRLCREAGAERVFLCNGSILEPIPESLGENVAYFKECGFEVGIWTDTIGHGFVLSHVEKGGDKERFTQMRDIMGNALGNANCPLDENFREYIAAHVAKLALLGPDIVMLDDDMRMSQHGYELCCACDAHLGRIGEILGRAVTLEELRPYVLTGKPNEYRDAWLVAQNEGLVEMARAIRAEVDKRTPDVTLCMCTACSVWNVDNTDVSGITRILAGKNKPILRLCGAPYWAAKRKNYPLIGVFEIARMLASFVNGEGFELMCEGDVYPRPRYTCPASYLELYDAVMRIDGGYSGILKYMFDYVAGPELEMGYLKAHAIDLPFLEKTHSLFDGGANAGVRVITRPHTMGAADLDISPIDPTTPRPLDGIMLASCGIPTLYRGKGICNSVFGENARELDLSMLKDGTVLDAVSALILTERGVDVGLEGCGTMTDKNITYLCTEDTEYKSYISDGGVRVLDASLRAGAEPLLFGAERTDYEPFAYRYENASGERFLVFMLDGASVYKRGVHTCVSGLIKNFATQRVLAEAIPWVARKPLPAYCVGNPELYIMCKKDEESMSIALFNCFADRLFEPTVMLDESYARIECVGCEATLDGDRITLTSPMHAYTSAMLRIYKS